MVCEKLVFSKAAKSMSLGDRNSIRIFRKCVMTKRLTNINKVVFLTCFFHLVYRKQVRQAIINPDWDFAKIGIGGLDKEFNAIFRRAFASRVFPPEVVEQLGAFLHFLLHHSFNFFSLIFYE